MELHQVITAASCVVERETKEQYGRVEQLRELTEGRTGSHVCALYTSCATTAPSWMIPPLMLLLFALLVAMPMC